MKLWLDSRDRNYGGNIYLHLDRLLGGFSLRRRHYFLQRSSVRKERKDGDIDADALFPLVGMINISVRSLA